MAGIKFFHSFEALALPIHYRSDEEHQILRCRSHDPLTPKGLSLHEQAPHALNKSHVYISIHHFVADVPFSGGVHDAREFDKGSREIELGL